MSDMLNGIEDGSIVRIKFKSIPELTSHNKMTSALQYMSEYDIGSNVNALVLGGDFVVVDASEIADKTHPHVDIHNHHDGGHFSVHTEMVDTIEIINVANKFMSEDHGIVMIQVEDKIYINGQLLENGNPDWCDEDRGKLTKFTEFMEKFVLAAAFEGSLDDDEETESNNK